MIHAYSEDYVDGAMVRMGDMLEYAVLDLGFDPDAFFKMFLDSTLARKFEIGEAAVVAGRSGPEIALMVIEEIDYAVPNISPAWRDGRSDVFWAGWILAYFQWYVNRPFRVIWKDISIRKLRKMYPVYHEMDIMQAVEEMEKMLRRPVKTNIATLRTVRGWTQKELADLAGMSVSQLQRLEYGERKVSNISLKTAISLADALGVDLREIG